MTRRTTPKKTKLAAAVENAVADRAPETKPDAVKPGQGELEYLVMYLREKLEAEKPSIQVVLGPQLGGCLDGLAAALGLGEPQPPPAS